MARENIPSFGKFVGVIAERRPKVLVAWKITNQDELQYTKAVMYTPFARIGDYVVTDKHGKKIIITKDKFDRDFIVKDDLDPKQ